MKEHILIIEDEKAIQSVLYELLIEAGYKVSLAGDGLEGLSLFHTQSFCSALTPAGGAVDEVVADARSPRGCISA